MAWATHLATGDVITFSNEAFGRVMVAVTGVSARGPQIKVHTDSRISIEKNGCLTVKATQEGFGLNDNTRE